MDDVERSMAEKVAIGRDGYRRGGRGVIVSEEGHTHAVRYLTRDEFFAEIQERFDISPDNDEHTRKLASLIDTYDPETEALFIAYRDDGFESFYVRAPIEATAAAPLFRADVSADYLGLIDRVPALAETGALETIAAIGWKGYQKQGKGVVMYLPTYGDLAFRSTREYAENLSSAFQGSADDVTVPDYDPLSEVLFATTMRKSEGEGAWVCFRLKAPKAPQRCRATWKPAPHTESA